MTEPPRFEKIVVYSQQLYYVQVSRSHVCKKLTVVVYFDKQNKISIIKLLI